MDSNRNGCGICTGAIGDLEGAKVARKTLSAKARNWKRRERERMLASDAFAKFSAKEGATISSQEAESFFRVDAYVTGVDRAQKIRRAKNLSGNDEELGPLIKLLEIKISKRSEE